MPKPEPLNIVSENEVVASVLCPRCGVSPGVPCATPMGKPAKMTHEVRIKEYHRQRFEAAMAVAKDEDRRLRDERDRRYRKEMPAKGAFKRRIKSYVWCDSHCEIHQSTEDHYEEGDTECVPRNWRRVYVETDDKTETFD